MLPANHLGVPREPLVGSALSTGRSCDPRVRVLDAMVATVSHRGYERTTVEGVLQTAGVPAALFDEHFENKEDCFLQALDGLIARAESRVLEAVRGAAPWPERVRSGLTALVGVLAEDPDGARVVLVECLSASSAARERHFALMRIFPPLLEEGRSHCTELERLPACLSEAMVGGIASILHHRALAGRTGELPRLCGELTYFALLPYLGHRRALGAAYAQKSPEMREAKLED
jgi:AcrR family transcriptional regulator